LISIGFDIGGTFTDFGMFDRSTDRWWFTKVRTTPADRAIACLEGVDTLLGDSGRPARDVGYIAHGSTVVTNTIIERKGAKTALITTEGFRDVLEIRRQVMPARYDVRVLKPEPLVPRLLRTEVPERVLSDGSVEKPLSGPSLQKLLGSLAAQGVESVAICFLHSYANPRNEQEALRIAAAAGDWYVCASHQVMNEFREYERTSTTVANAYVAPPMRHYLGRLENGLKDKAGISTPLLIFQSNGGVVPTSQAKETPIACVLSGPASGVIASCAVASQSGFGDFISLDMGGTSCDVSLVKDNKPTIAFEQDIAGWAIRTPRLDIHTVGAGGGSIAWMDVGRLLRVGPQSAGAEPGPACYGQGGQKAAVTDANVLLGRLNPSHLLGGRMELTSGLARDAVGRLAAELGLGVDEAAAGIVDVVNSTMVRAIRVVSVERGYDPRDFALLAFGGAGPVHAADLARELHMPMVVVPAYPGLLCALGLLVSDLRADGSLTRRMRMDEAPTSVIRECFEQVENSLREGRAVSSRPNADWRPSYSTDMRYLGQSFELRIAVPGGKLDDASLSALADAFDREHERFYGFATPSAPKEIVCFRASLQAPAGLKASELPKYPRADKARPVGHRRVFFSEGGWVKDCPVYQRESLAPNTRQSGPAVIEQMDTTTVVPPDFDFEIDGATNLILKKR
jgi:N-methylhydantoinase A